MSRRTSIESRILDYFNTAHLDRVEVMFALVKEAVKKRHPVKPPVFTAVPPAQGPHSPTLDYTEKERKSSA